MRIVLLLTITLLGGVAGFFTGGYAYNLGHPIQRMPSGLEPGSRQRGLQAAHLAVANAMERHRGRHNWLIGGALGGAGIGFVGTVLVSLVGYNQGRRGRDETDIPA